MLNQAWHQYRHGSPERRVYFLDEESYAPPVVGRSDDTGPSTEGPIIQKPTGNSQAETDRERGRFERHFVEIDLDYPSGVDNRRIDADLAREHAAASVRAFVDANVLANIISQDPERSRLLASFRSAGLELVTYIKCIYELYSLVKGTTKAGAQKNHPLRHLLPVEINDIAQRLFRPMKSIAVQANSFYWYSLCEEWRGWDYFKRQKPISALPDPADREQAEAHLNAQQEWVAWKHAVNRAMDEIDSRIARAGIGVLDHSSVFQDYDAAARQVSSSRSLARDTLLPNEDFELVLAAIWMNARVFITEDARLILRGGATLGLNGPPLSFCHPSRLSEALGDGFGCRYYLAGD